MSILDWDRKVMLETDNRPVIRGYDEPDANLHYDAQRKMFYSLRDLTAGERTKIQAVVCTHSLSMIDRAPAQNINLLRLDQEGKCQVSYLSTNGDEEIAEFLGDMSRSMGVPNSALFYERCFILVEGPTEENSLPTIYRNLHESSLIEDGIRIVNIGGCGGWASFVKMMGINKKDLMLFLLDNDCNQPESSCELNEQTLLELGFDADFMKTNVFYIGSKEYEDAFSSETYAAVLNRCWPKASGDLWKPSDVDALRSDPKFSDRIVIEANRYSRMGRNKGCTKPKLGLEVARHCKNAVDVPEPIRQVFAKARVIANPV